MDAGARDDVYHACRALLVCRRDDLPIFDRAFRDFWGDATRRRAAGSMPQETESGGADPAVGQAQPDDADGESGLDDARDAIGMWSDVARLAGKDFAEFTPAEMTRAAQRAGAPAMAARMAPQPPLGGQARAHHRFAARSWPRREQRGRADGVADAPPAAAPAPAGARVRRQRLDGALLAHAGALRARRCPSSRARRGVSVFDRA